jgi:hypothetical protein
VWGYEMRKGEGRTVRGRKTKGRREEREGDKREDDAGSVEEVTLSAKTTRELHVCGEKQPGQAEEKGKRWRRKRTLGLDGDGLAVKTAKVGVLEEVDEAVGERSSTKGKVRRGRNRTHYASAASCKPKMAAACQRNSLPIPLAISRTRRWKL